MAEEKSIMGDIGFEAGDVYRELENSSGKLKATDLKNSLDLSTSSIYLALGWLAREDKVKVYKKGNSVRVELT
ncbi:MAG: winged helix-turn-helix domain-containing protein [bacterium]